MKRSSRIFWTVMAAGMLLSGVTCFSQNRSLSELQAELRANVRREMGLDSSPRTGQVAVTEMATERAAPEKRSGGTESVDTNNIVLIGAAIVSTVLVTAILMSLFGGRRKNKPAAFKGGYSRSEESEYHGRKDKDTERIKQAFPKEEPKADTAIDIYEKIERLQALRDKGVLSEMEFSDKKKELLNRI